LKGTSSERVDDVPVVIKWLSQMQIEALINQEVPPPHGNRKGLSYGQLAVLLLSYIITQADHRLCAVESWVKQHHQTLELATGWKIEVAEPDQESAPLLDFGYSKDRRPDLRQYRQMLATLDPLGVRAMVGDSFSCPGTATD
jgi:transposase